MLIGVEEEDNDEEEEEIFNSKITFEQMHPFPAGVVVPGSHLGIAVVCHALQTSTY